MSIFINSHLFLQILISKYRMFDNVKEAGPLGEDPESS